MKINIMFAFFIIFYLSYADGVLEIEKRREEQKKFEEKVENFENKTLGDEKANSSSLNLDINNIFLVGNTVFEEFQINSILKKYIGKDKDIYSLINEIENKYIAKGYVTTRVNLDLEKSDLASGNISLFILEGKIDKYIFDGEEKIIKEFITFPQQENKLLNMYDLDQGIDNLGDNSTLEIKSSNKENYSDIHIRRGDKKILDVSIGYNDLGQKGTGRHRYRINLNSHDLFGLNENINYTFQDKLQRQKKDRDSGNYSFSINIPFKKYSFSYSFAKSDYLQTIRALGKRHRATGTTENQSFGVRKMMYRNGDSKVDFGGNITLKDVKNYIDDVRLITGSRKLSVLTLDSSYIGRVLGGLFYSDVSVSFGLKKFGANIDDNEWYRTDTSPKAQFRKYNLDLSWYKPINKFYYKLNIGAQYSKDILYSQEKLSLGDDTTVRGFKDESIQGDSGVYIRNEIGYRGMDILEPFIAYDFGRIKNNKIEEDRYESVQGVSIGTKISLRALEGSVALAKPIDKPGYFEEDKVVVYTSLTYRF